MKEANVTMLNMKVKPVRKKRTGHSWLSLKRNKLLYLMILPGFLYFVIFKYLPMGGLIIAFQDYQPFLGIADSPGLGLSISSDCLPNQPSLCY